jgi:hypothetical protein
MDGMELVYAVGVNPYPPALAHTWVHPSLAGQCELQMLSKNRPRFL